MGVLCAHIYLFIHRLNVCMAAGHGGRPWAEHARRAAAVESAHDLVQHHRREPAERRALQLYCHCWSPTTFASFFRQVS
jgi:hypothetical protein